MATIAIDPDIDKNGVATYSGGNIITIESMAFPILMEYIKAKKEEFGDINVIVEAGWMNKSFYHMTAYDTKAVLAKKGYNVGENHRTGKLIIECAKHIGAKVIEQRPLLKCWKGKDRKITHEELEGQARMKMLHLSKQRSNQEERDAALILITNLRRK